MKKILILLAGALFSLASCLAFGQTTVIDNSEMATILATVNKGEIKAATKAQTKASNPEVLRFAKLMISDHQNADQSAKQVFKKVKAGTQPSMYSRNLKRESNAAMKKMKKLQGAAFDQAYMDSQVTMHQNVLNLIDNTLLPSAKSPDVKTLLGNLRTMIDAHLQQAKQIRSTL